jgi:hypothetical protein
MVENSRWRLEAAFWEDGSHTLIAPTAYHLNIVEKTAVNTLRQADAGIAGISMKNKRCLISMNFRRYLDILTALQQWFSGGVWLLPLFMCLSWYK